MFNPPDHFAIFLNDNKKQQRQKGCAMPHQTDITERLGNRPGGATPEERTCINALYERGRPNDVGQAFAAVCQGRVPEDPVAVSCLRGMELVNDQAHLTERGTRLRGLVIG